MQYTNDKPKNPTINASLFSTHIKVVGWPIFRLSHFELFIVQGFIILSRWACDRVWRSFFSGKKHAARIGGYSSGEYSGNKWRVSKFFGVCIPKILRHLQRGYQKIFPFLLSQKIFSIFNDAYHNFFQFLKVLEHMVQFVLPRQSVLKIWSNWINLMRRFVIKKRIQVSITILIP